jgi:hypothetical protein
MTRVWIACLVAIALAAARPGAAAAERRGYSIGPRPVWFLTGGGTAGGTVAAAPRGGYLGGELSLVRLADRRFVGLYADAYYDFGVDGMYVTLGPELGWIRRSRTFPIAVGIDGGGVLRAAEERALGVAGRVFLTLLGSVSLYGRYAYLDADRADHVVQVGVTLKFPLAPPFGAGAR